MAFLWCVFSAVLIAGDQFVKFLVTENMNLSDSFNALPGVLEFVYVQNSGAAFSILSGRVPLLSIVSILFCIGVAVFCIWKRPQKPLLCAALAMMFAGAFGNAIDRIFRGYVVDFIKLSFVNFPVFNIADIAIVLGAVLLVIYVVWFDEKSEEKNK